MNFWTKVLAGAALVTMSTLCFVVGMNLRLASSRQAISFVTVGGALLCRSPYNFGIAELVSHDPQRLREIGCFRSSGGTPVLRLKPDYLNKNQDVWMVRLKEPDGPAITVWGNGKAFYPRGRLGRWASLRWYE